jgi:GH15 family glucan-1,4-alpha-glucosidase
VNNFTFSTANLENYKPLEAYGLIGDNSTAVLVGADGSIDWACLPAFDAPAVFAALLDPGAGRFRICPTQPYTSRQLYEPGTNILITEFVTSTGSCRLRDFMPSISR